MAEDREDYPVDLIYMWVDGNDKEWREKHARFSGKDYSNEGKDCEGRYTDNDELKYSLRSIEENAPWINRIFIVTDNQVPHWLNTDNPKIKIIDHHEIIPEEYLPSFNSTVIEHFLHRIPGLSEHYLFANDDCFINRPVKKEDFFTSEGFPVIRLNRRWFRKLTLKFRKHIRKKPESHYNHIVENAARLVEKKYGRYIGHKSHHNIDSYNKSFIEEIFRDCETELKAFFPHHLRDNSDIQRSLYSYAAIIKKKAKRVFVNNKTSFRFPLEKTHYYKRFEKNNPLFFCMNDSEFVTDHHRKLEHDFLNRRFPKKSRFEK